MKDCGLWQSFNWKYIDIDTWQFFKKKKVNEILKIKTKFEVSKARYGYKNDSEQIFLLNPIYIH